MNFDELKSRPVEDLRLLAAQYGIKTHHRAKAETIAKLIVEHATTPVKPSVDAMKHPAEQTKAPPPVNTQDAVLAAVNHLVTKPGFTATFPGDDTVVFKYKGAEESVHLSTIMRVIRTRAQFVAEGAKNPRVLRDSQTNATINSGTIMMV